MEYAAFCVETLRWDSFMKSWNSGSRSGLVQNSDSEDGGSARNGNAPVEPSAHSGGWNPPFIRRVQSPPLARLLLHMQGLAYSSLARPHEGRTEGELVWTDACR